MQSLWHWIDRNILELGREMRWSYLPPLMVYVAAGVSGYLVRPVTLDVIRGSRAPLAASPVGAERLPR